MPVHGFQTRAQEEQLRGEIIQRDGRLLTHEAMATKQVSDLVAATHNMYPWQRPGVVEAMAKEGIPPGSSIAQQIATVAGRDYAQSGDNIANGSIVNAADINRTPDFASSEAPSVIGDIFGAVGSGLSWLGDEVEDLPGGSMVTRVLGAAGRRASDAGGWFGDNVPGLKDFTRGGMATLSSPFQEASAVLTSYGDTIHESDGAFNQVMSAFTAFNPGSEANQRLNHTYLNRAKRSDLANAISAGGWDAFMDEDLTGSGFFVGGAVLEEGEQQKQRITMDGGGFATPGRYIPQLINRVAPGTLIEPGTRPYSLLSGLGDAGLNWFGDPTAKAGQLARSASQARKTFGEGAGLVDSMRRTTIAERATRWLDSEDAARLTTWIADTDSVTELKRIKGVDNQLADELSQITDPALVRQKLASKVGREIVETPRVPGFSMLTPKAGDVQYAMDANARFRNSVWQRAFGEVPDNYLSAFNVEEGYDVLQGFMRNLRTDAGDMEKLNRKFVKLPKGDTDKFYEFVTNDLADVIEKQLKVHGSGEYAPQLKRVFKNFEKDRAYWVSEAGAASPLNPLAKVLKNGSTQHARHLIAEQLNRGVGLPDARQMRRLTSGKYTQAVLGNAGVAATLNSAEFVQQQFWKPFALLRGAYFARVVGEEQLRMSGLSLTSSFNHPIEFLKWRVGGRTQLRSKIEEGGGGISKRVVPGNAQRKVENQGWLAKFDEGVANGLSRGDARKLADKDVGRSGSQIRKRLYAKNAIGDLDAEGEAMELASERIAAMSRREGWINSAKATGVTYIDEYHPISKADPNYFTGIADELGIVASDDVGRRVARAMRNPDQFTSTLPNGDTVNGLDAIKREFFGGEFDEFRQTLMTDDISKQVLGSRHARTKTVQGQGPIQKINSADDYIDSHVERIQQITGGNEELIEAVASGRLRGERIARAKFDTAKVNKILAQDFEPHLPEWTRVQKTIADKNLRGQVMDSWDRALDYGFDFLMGRRTDELSRNITFKQMYWNRRIELMSFGTDEMAETTLAAMRKTNLPDRMVKRGEQVRGRLGKTTNEISSAEDLDKLAKAYALNETKKLLYDLSKRSQFADISRIIAPFAEAWKEMITTWPRIIKENPSVIRRAQQGITGARQSNPLDIVDPTSDGDPSEGPGFFFPDDSSGEEMFAYPLLGTIAGAVTGMGSNEAEGGFNAPVSGLNMASGGPVGILMPGVGPMVQIPAGSFLRDKQGFGWEWAKKIIMPYGAPEYEEGIGGIADTLAPPWLGKLAKGWFGNPKADRSLANTTGDVWNAMILNGELPQPQSTQEMGEQMAIAGAAAKKFWLIRGIAQFFVPSSPMPAFRTQNKEGDWWAFEAVGRQYREWNEEYGSQQATAMLSSYFGTENIAMLENKSKAIFQRPMDETGADWQRANQGLFDKHREVAGWFAPEDQQAPFDYQAYIASEQEGARAFLSPIQSKMQTNDFLGNLAYDNARQIAEQQFGSQSSAEAQQYLRIMRASLAEKFPGFGQTVGVAGAPTAVELVEKFRPAVEEEVIAATPQGKATRELLSLYDQAMSVAIGRGRAGFGSSNDTADLRANFRAQGLGVVERFPEALGIWERVFMRAIKDEQDEQLSDPLMGSSSSQPASAPASPWQFG